MKQLARRLFIVLAVAVLTAQPAAAQFHTQEELIDDGVTAYELNADCTTTGDDSGGVDGSKGQKAKVKTIIGVAKALKMTRKAALIAFMTVYQESTFNNYGNDSTPELKAVSESNPNFEGFPEWGSDHDSVGIFQQRPSADWSTFGSGYSQDIVWQIMGDTKSEHAVAYAAQAFLGTPDSIKLPSKLANPGALRKGLINKVPNYNDPSVDPGVAAQTVQASAFPDAYKKHESKAQRLVDDNWDKSPQIPLAMGETTDTNNDSCTDTGSGTAQERILRAIRKYALPDYTPFLPGIQNATQAYQTDIARGQYKGACGGVDCGAFVTLVMRKSGADRGYNPERGDTVAQRDYLREQAQKGTYTKLDLLHSIAKMLLGGFKGVFSFGKRHGASLGRLVVYGKGGALRVNHNIHAHRIAKGAAQPGDKANNNH